MTAVPTSRLSLVEHDAAIKAICNELTRIEIFDDRVLEGSDADLSIKKLAVRSGLTPDHIEYQVFEELPHVSQANELDRADIFFPQDDDPILH